MTPKHEQEGIDLGHLFRCDVCGNAYEIELMKECMGDKYCPGCWEDLDPKFMPIQESSKKETK